MVFPYLFADEVRLRLRAVLASSSHFEIFLTPTSSLSSLSSSESVKRDQVDWNEQAFTRRRSTVRVAFAFLLSSTRKSPERRPRLLKKYKANAATLR